MAKTVVGLMETPREAESVVQDLTRSCGCSRNDIGLMARGEQSEASGGAGTTGDQGSEMASGALKGATGGAAIGGVLGLVAGVASLSIPGFGPFIAAGPIAAALGGAGIGAVAGGVIGALTNMGVPEEEAHYYAEGVRRGGTLITVHAKGDDTAQCAAEVMRKHGAADIEQRASRWKEQGWGGRFSADAADEEMLPVAKEELAVGKREVNQGGVRVYSHVTERPVEQSVSLREEHASIERRPVDRAVASGDDAFREKSVEVRETAEEPVVSKRARVTEEVRVGQQASQRQQTVRENVRETEVRAERTDGGTLKKPARAGAATTAYPGPERRRRRMAFSGADRRAGVAR